MRTVAVRIARGLPPWFKQWVHDNRALDRVARRAFARLTGAGRRAVIADGPLAGLALVAGEHVSHAHLSGTYERDVQEAVDRLVRPGDVCYDLGASIGYLTLLMARRAREVFAFEPAPHAAAEIRKHCAANGFANVRVVEQPVSDVRKSVRFAVTDVAYGSSIAGQEESRWPTLEFVTTTLDEFARDHPAPDFIKMDVEGEEGRALDGAGALLALGRTTFCIELHGLAVAREVVAALDAHGYTAETLDGRPFELPATVLPGALQIVSRAPRRGS